jgi:hypothetical protein
LSHETNRREFIKVTTLTAGGAAGNAKPETHILGESFVTTTAALRYGDYVAKLGVVTDLGAQEAYSPARRVDADDVSSFSPFHCLPEHRPLGSVMRARRQAYEESSRYCHEMNEQRWIKPSSSAFACQSMGPQRRRLGNYRVSFSSQMA